MTTLGAAVARGTALLVGLCGYGISMAMMVRSGLGLDPWDVFHQGLATHTGMTIGLASGVVGALVLLAWIPLRNRPGVGTVANVIVIAVTVDAGLAVLPELSSLPAQSALMLGGVLLNALSTVLYVGAGLGPGPRDGLMTGLVTRTGWSVRLVRTGIEATVLAVGWLLGGTVGVGTVLYAVGIGPLIQLVLRLTPSSVLAHSGWAPVAEARRRRETGTVAEARRRRETGTVAEARRRHEMGTVAVARHNRDPQGDPRAGYGTMGECRPRETPTRSPTLTCCSTSQGSHCVGAAGPSSVPSPGRSNSTNAG
jgi:uncharacterized membrane protein YczE